MDSVKIRTRSDRKLGVLLSGGLDSSAICYQLSRLGNSIEALSAVSPGSPFDESKYARMVAKHLKLNHSEVDLNRSARDFIDYIPKATFHNDAPVGSFSNIAHMWLMEEAKKLGITVILSGQGADESLLWLSQREGEVPSFLSTKFKKIKNLLLRLEKLLVTLLSMGLLSLISISTKLEDIFLDRKAKNNFWRYFIASAPREYWTATLSKNLKDRQMDDLNKILRPLSQVIVEDRPCRWQWVDTRIRLPF